MNTGLLLRRCPVEKILRAVVVTLVAGAGVRRIEGHGHPVTGAARFSFTHLLHGVVLTGHTGLDQLVVAVTASETTADVHLVAEENAAGLARHVEPDRLRDLVALVAIAGRGEGGLVVMAGTARLPLLHVGHGETFVAWSGDKNLVVALVAAIEGEVKLMAEDRPGFLELDLPYGMAAGTVLLDAKGGLPVMTGTARLPRLHVGHAEALGSRARGENAVVALTALEHPGVDLVTEGAPLPCAP